MRRNKSIPVSPSPNPEPNIETLLELLAIPGVSGDEGAIGDWLETTLASWEGVTLTRIGDNILAIKGAPHTAIFAHTDTVGYTLGYRDTLIPVGGPQPEDREPMRCDDGLTGRLRLREVAKGKPETRIELRNVVNPKGKEVEGVPGSRWIYARKPKIENGFIISPYLDNRAGVWTALRALYRCPNIAIAFATGEEQHGHGARVCADWLYRTYAITQALIADITWHTEDTPCGKGVAISLRDAFSPRQRFLDRIVSLAAESKITHQKEIQSAGSSDGGHILRSNVPMDGTSYLPRTGQPGRPGGHDGFTGVSGGVIGSLDDSGMGLFVYAIQGRVPRSCQKRSR
jgi:hypothetical protein